MRSFKKLSRPAKRAKVDKFRRNNLKFFGKSLVSGAAPKRTTSLLCSNPLAQTGLRFPTIVKSKTSVMVWLMKSPPPFLALLNHNYFRLRIIFSARRSAPTLNGQSSH